jgi:hypothetical protein
MKHLKYRFFACAAGGSHFKHIELTLGPQSHHMTLVEFDLDRRATMTMNLLWLVVICWSRCVLTQPLESAQYTALMSVYDGLGSSLVAANVLRFQSFFFFFLQDATMRRFVLDSMRRRAVLALC